MEAKGIDIDLDSGIFEIMEIPDFINHPPTSEDRSDLSTGQIMTNPREPQLPPPPLSQQEVKDWKKKHGRWVTPTANVVSPDTTDSDVEMTFQVLGSKDEEATLTLSLNNTMVKSTRYKPPMSWVRYMAKSLGSREAALALWWKRIHSCPETFDKGFFQEHMLRKPSHREIKHLDLVVTRPNGLSKSEWQRCLYKGLSAEDFQKSVKKETLRKADAKKYLDDAGSSFYESLKRKGILKKPDKSAKVNKRDVKKSLYDNYIFKGLSPYDFSSCGSLKDQINLSDEDLRDYFMLYVDACARDVYNSLNAKFIAQWWEKNPMPKVDARATYGDIEALESVNITPSTYKPDFSEIANRCWEMLIVQLPKNKNLLKAKRYLKVTKDMLVTLVKNVDYNKVC